ncbi:MAG TPA: DUF3800 domain-containing protein [Baekduia sp.]|nr:DUF3800 domain-containing protein [Baekduia sp.]
MTLLFYIDESRDALHHFHLGVLATGSQVAAIEQDLEAIVETAFDAGACRWRAELHGVALFHGNDDWDKATAAQRINVYESALTLLPTHGVEVLARGANLARFAKRYGGGDPYRWEFSNLLERLNERLRSLDEYGLVIADEQHEYRDILRRDLADSKQSGTGGYRSQRLTRVLDTAHFVDSKLSRTTQLADLIAFIIRRRASCPTESDPRQEAVMSGLFQLVHDAIPDPKGQYYTVRWS